MRGLWQLLTLSLTAVLILVSSSAWSLASIQTVTTTQQKTGGGGYSFTALIIAALIGLLVGLLLGLAFRR
jgi:hypothetical protein